MRRNPLEALVAWVEKDVEPDYLVAQHRTNGVVDNQRRICAYPQRAVYVGPAGGQNDTVNGGKATSRAGESPPRSLAPVYFVRSNL